MHPARPTNDDNANRRSGSRASVRSEQWFVGNNRVKKRHSRKLPSNPHPLLLVRYFINLYGIKRVNNGSMFRGKNQLFLETSSIVHAFPAASRNNIINPIEHFPRTARHREIRSKYIGIRGRCNYRAVHDVRSNPCERVNRRDSLSRAIVVTLR